MRTGLITIVAGRHAHLQRQQEGIAAGTVLPDVRVVVAMRAAEAQLHVFYQGIAKEQPAAFPAQGFTTRLDNYLDVTVASGDMRTTLRAASAAAISR